MIKFADRSEAGWVVVEEYEDDALASNSEDEKRMEKAVREADRKMAKKRKLRDSKEAARKEVVRPELPPTFASTKPPSIPKMTGNMVLSPWGHASTVVSWAIFRGNARRHWPVCRIL